MAILTIVGFIILCIAIFHFSPVTDIVNEVNSKYSICSYYTKVKVINKEITTQYNRLIFTITTQLKDTTIVSEVTPKDYNKIDIDETVYIFINDDGTRVCDICQEDEIEERINILSRLPLRIDIKEMEGC